MEILRNEKEKISTHLFDAEKIFKGSKDTVASLPYTGFAAQSRHKDPILYIVVNRDKDYEDQTRESTLLHEYEHMKNILFRKIFDQQAVAAFDHLETEGKYTREEIIAMLADKSLPEWPKAAKRLLEQKKLRKINGSSDEYFPFHQKNIISYSTSIRTSESFGCESPVLMRASSSKNRKRSAAHCARVSARASAAVFLATNG